MTKKYDLTYLSLGAGVQSTALYFMSARGDHGVERVDYAVFADTGDEPQWVYDTLDRIRKADAGIPVEVVTAGKLSTDTINKIDGGRRVASLPLFSDGGLMPRQCTKAYKIEPIKQWARAKLGVEKRQRVGARSAKCLIGISLDEVVRMKPSPLKWQTNSWPLVDARLRRSDCLRYLDSISFQRPYRSACVYCPFHSDIEWEFIKSHPMEWAKVVMFDRQIRDMTSVGVKVPQYLHRSCKPIDEVEFTDKNQMSFFGSECEGLCGV